MQNPKTEGTGFLIKEKKRKKTKKPISGFSHNMILDTDESFLKLLWKQIHFLFHDMEKSAKTVKTLAVF